MYRLSALALTCAALLTVGAAHAQTEVRATLSLIHIGVGTAWVNSWRWP